MRSGNEIHRIQYQTASKNMQFLKNSNRAAVIRALALKRASNRTELACQLNLTKMAIGNIVNELMEESYIREVSPSYAAGDPSLSSNGRRPKLLSIADWSINTICINIRRYSVSGMLMDINGHTKYPFTEEIPEYADNDILLHILVACIQEILRQSTDLPIIGIGVSSIGPIDLYKKKLLNPPDFRNIHYLDIGDILQEHFHLPVYMDNDMNSSALAELYFGTGISHRDLVFLGFSSGVGAGIITNEKILHGFGGFAGEVGHISINPHGPLCPCGQRGCIELYTMGQNILKNVGLNSFKELVSILKHENPPMYITKFMEEYQNTMRTLVVCIANIYDPNIIVLGDIDIPFIVRFIPDLEEYMNSHMLNKGYKHIPIVPSTLAEAAPLYGAGSIVFQRIFDGEILLPGRYSSESA